MGYAPTYSNLPFFIRIVAFIMGRSPVPVITLPPIIAMGFSWDWRILKIIRKIVMKSFCNSLIGFKLSCHVRI